jgi:hypothetical protein
MGYSLINSACGLFYRSSFGRLFSDDASVIELTASMIFPYMMIYGIMDHWKVTTLQNSIKPNPSFWNFKEEEKTIDQPVQLPSHLLRSTHLLCASEVLGSQCSPQ